MILEDLMRVLDEMAPARLAEDWDNVGLLLGDPNQPVRKVFTCLTITPEVAIEAIDAGADVMVSHHPILFRAVKAVRADRPGTDVVWKLARAGIAVISRHTAWDSAEGGANDLIARVLGLKGVRPLRPASPPECVKFVVFVPDDHAEAVLQAAFGAGAGHIGLYDECSFSGTGTGTFRGREGANPTIGKVGNRESVSETRLEFICPKSILNRVMRAVRTAHPYEEPAVDVFALETLAADPKAGVGRIGEVDGWIGLEGLARLAAEGLNSHATQWALAAGRSLSDRVRRVAIACGAGDDLISDAIAAGADCVVTGELRYHTVLTARQAGLSVVLVGHHASERVSMEALAARLAARLPEIGVWSSRAEEEPLVNLSGPGRAFGDQEPGV